jgi:hypothetical protein
MEFGGGRVKNFKELKVSQKAHETTLTDSLFSTGGALRVDEPASTFGSIDRSEYR